MKIWTKDDGNGNNIFGYTAQVINEHKDWVRDVSWLNYVGNAYDTIVSCGEDKQFIIWQFKGNKWKNEYSKTFNSPVWNASWSNCGSCLGISTGDNQIHIFKQNIGNDWELISCIDEKGKMIESELAENK